MEVLVWWLWHWGSQRELCLSAVPRAMASSLTFPDKKGVAGIISVTHGVLSAFCGPNNRLFIEDDPGWSLQFCSLTCAGPYILVGFHPLV